MAFYQYYYCKISILSDKKRKEHEIMCSKNPKNIKMTTKHFKERMRLKKTN